MPRTVRAAAAIQLPIEACWEKLRDLSLASNYVPKVVQVVMLTEQREGVGTSRRVTHSQFGDMDETVIDWRSGEGFTLRLHRGDRSPPPFSEASFDYSLRPITEQTTAIQTSLTYTLPLGALGRALDTILFHRIPRQSVIDTAVSLAEHYHTDAPVPLPKVKPLRAHLIDPI